MIDFKNIKKPKDKLGAVYSLVEQMRLEHNRQSAYVRKHPEYKDKWASYAKLFKSRLHPLMRESVGLRKLIRLSVVDDEVWKSLDNDEREAILEPIHEIKQEYKTQDTKAVSDDLEYLKTVDIASLDSKSIPDPVEDFTSANWNNGTPQDDEDSDLTVIANKVTATDYNRLHHLYHYRTHTVAGDYEWIYTIYNAAISRYAGICYAIGSDGIGDVGASIDSWGGRTYYYYTAYVRLYVVYYANGSLDDSDYYSIGNSGPYTKYVIMDRTGAVLTSLVYTEASHDTLEDTIACGCPEIDADYIYSFQSNDANYDCSLTAYIEDLDLQEAVGGWTNIAKVHGVTATDLGKVNGTAVAAIAKMNGVAV